METAIQAVKLIGGFVAGTGVSAVVKNLIKVTTPEDVGKATKACIWIGGVFVAGLAAKAASDQLDGKIDTVVKYAKKAIDKVIPKKEEQKEEEDCNMTDPEDYG
jgi:hypothetical protein